MRDGRPYRGMRAAAVTAAFGLLVAGCSQGTGAATPEGGVTAREPGRPAGEVASDEVAEQSSVAVGGAARPRGARSQASGPAGDPPLEPSALGPGPAGAEPRPPAGDRGPRTVPVRALLTVEDLRRTYGGPWQRRAGGGDACVVPQGALAERTTSYDGTPTGTVTETVAAYGDIRRADAAVLDLRYTAERCGWTGVHDPRIGSAAVAAVDDQGRSMTAVAADGVLVVLVGAGRVATDQEWDALVDLAVGSSCPAAVGGCR